ncbi:LPP20 family lipoprotein [Marinospirillum insulare]|uniref:Lipoprotein LPP20-like domain-containing protein n=1 Tax=Marinospirillum insulare TaxID=217169 RepID=A0ABQ5ZSB8_9GAMM|nr:LPP20 family lipoprotein [Marinospirillum insulare]GLR63021.1 hypothetical protein GCM10007878_04560 [Marinospirillum insulare]
MINKTLLTGLMLLGLTLILGCASKDEAEEPVTEKEVRVLDMGSFDPVVLRVNGYGTHGKTDVQTTPNQRNLMAMRASKLDAYRSMAERVYGTRIQGNTTVQNLATRDDHIRGYVDNLVRGAKVVSTRDLGNGSYETLMELVLEPRFQHCMLRSESMAADPSCAKYTIHGEHPSQRLPISQNQPRARYHLN